MTGTIMPSPVLTLLDTSGNPVVSGKLYTYLAGTTTPVATYTDSGLGTANANPVISDAAGRMSVWLSPEASYKFVAKTSADVTLWTVDDIESVPGSLATVGGVNLIKDPTFLIWAAGDAAAPTHWANVVAGVTIARETSIIKIGPMCAKMTPTPSDEAFLEQYIMPAATYSSSWMNGRTVALGAWVYCSTANRARVYLYEGNSTTYSSYHTGSGSWEWLTVKITLTGASTALSAGLSTITSVAYISGPTCLLGSGIPGQYQPAPVVYSTIRFSYAGTVATGTQIDTWVPERPGIIKQVQLFAKTAPVGAAMIVDVNTWDGAAYTTAFTTKPTIADGATSGGAVPDGTYARRCFSTFVGTTAYPTSAGQMITADVDQVGSGTAGANLGIHIRVLQYASPLEAFLGPTEIQ